VHLHDEVRQPMHDVVSALEDLRIAYRSGATAGIGRALGEIDRATDKIDQALRTASS
jgi:hypothetical protein